MKSTVIERIEASQYNNPIQLTVGTNKLRLYDGKQWLLDSSDVDVAASEIMSLVAENNRLKSQCARAERELKEALEMKRVSLALLTEERLRTIILEQQISGYKEELAQSIREVVVLRSRASALSGPTKKTKKNQKVSRPVDELPQKQAPRVMGGGGASSSKLETVNRLLAFVADRDAKTIQKACAGLGTNDSLLISVLCSRTKKQILQANTSFRSLYADRSISETVDSECSGDYRKFLLYVCDPRGVYLSKRLCEAMDGIGCNCSLVNEIFCLSSSEEIFAMRAVYEKKFDTKLADRLRAELSGEHETLIMYLLLNGRGNGPVDPKTARETAQRIHQDISEGRGMLGGLKDTAKKQIGQLLARSSPVQCVAIQDAWERLYPGSKSLELTLRDKLGGKFEEACLLLLKSPEVAWCEKMQAAMKGLGTDENTLSRALGGVDKHQAVALAELYQSKYGKSLAVELKSELSGDYLKAVLAWLSQPDPTDGLERQLDSTSPDSPEFELLVTKSIRNIKASIAQLDVDLLKLATKGIGTDERLVVSVLCGRSKSDLKQVDLFYREKYERSLKEYINREMGGDLAQFLSYTQMGESEFDAHILKKACDGLGTNERVIMEVVCTRSYERLIAAKEYYEKAYDGSLLDMLRSELSGTLDKVCARLFRNPRHVSDSFNPTDLARELYEAGAGRFGTEEEKFIEILTGHSVEQLQEVCQAYEMQFECSLDKAISSEFSGDAKEVLLLLLLPPVDIYCRKLQKATVGQIGTDEGAVNRIIGGNEKETVYLIASRYFSKYNRSLVDDLRGELSGDYRSAVLTYICTSHPDGGMDLLNSVDPPPALRAHR